MEIGPVRHGGQMQPSDKKQTRPEQETPQQAPRDRVEISQDARRRLAELADAALKSQSSESSTRTGDAFVAADQYGSDGKKVAEHGEASTSETARDAKLAEVRRRIEAGFYDKPEVKQEIADRLADEMES